MVEEYEICLERQSYCPGQTVNGYVEVGLSSERRIRAIRLRFKGRTKILWREGRYGHYRGDETYFDVESILLGDTVIPRGRHRYQFTFDLPYDVPPTLKKDLGDILYSVQATISRPWSFNHVEKKHFLVYTYTDLNSDEDARRPIEVTKTKRLFSLLSDGGLVHITVRIPVRGFVPSQIVNFSAHVQNHSAANVKEVRFRLVQRFTFHTKLRNKTVDCAVGEQFTIVDSFVPRNSEKSWEVLELRVPSDVFTGDLAACNIISSYLELRGEVVLPLPYRNAEVLIPLMVGDLPLLSDSS